MKLFKSKWGQWLDIIVFPCDYNNYLLQMSIHEDGRKRFRRVFIPYYFAMTADTHAKMAM